MEKISLKKELGKFLVFFSILYIAVFIILNLTGWLIRPPKIQPSLQDQALQVSPEKETPKCVLSEKPNSISIPKIGIEAPIVFPENADEKKLIEELDNGVVHYPGSPFPGNNGQVVLLGHSAPLGWPKLRYDWVFSDLNKLEVGDEIFISFEKCQYQYRVSEKFFLDKGQEVPESSGNYKSTLVLISCWPPGKNIRRIAVLSILDKSN